MIKKSFQFILLFTVAFIAISLVTKTDMLHSQEELGIMFTGGDDAADSKPTSDEKQTNQTSKEVSMVNRYIETQVHNLSDVLKETFLGPLSSPFLISVIIIPLLILITYILGVLVKFLITKPALFIFSKSFTEEKDRDLFRSAANMTAPLFLILGIRASVVPLETWLNYKLVWFNSLLNAIFIIALTLFIGRIVISLISAWGHKFTEKTESNIDDQLLPLALGTARFIFYTFGFLIALSSMGANIGPIIASLGALSFALGFAVKDSLSNFMAGIFLVLEKSFMIGDKVDIPGIGLGFIYEIGLRTTKLRTFDHELIVIPNNILMNKEFKNFRLPDVKIRVVVKFGVAYGSDPDHVRAEILDEVGSIKGLLNDPAPSVDFLSMGDSSLDFQARFFVDNYGDQWDKKIECTDRIYKRLQRVGIDIPFPTRTLYLKKEN